jgi:hypothetical protein
VHIDHVNTCTDVAEVVETQMPLRVGKNTITVMLAA